MQQVAGTTLARRYPLAERRPFALFQPDHVSLVHAEAWTVGGEAYILSNLLTGLDDEQAAGVLRRCREAMAAGGRVLLIEWVVPAAGEITDAFKSSDTTALDLTMLSIDGAGGWRVRTAEEFRAVLAAGGLTVAETIPTVSSVSIIEARPTRTESG